MEYVMEAVKQGSAVIDLRSTTRAVLVSVNKTSLEISLHQKKIFKADDHMGEVLENVVAFGIRGSFLVPLFVHIALQTEKEASEFAKARQLHFLANFDLIDVAWNITGLNPETTLGISCGGIKNIHYSRDHAERPDSKGVDLVRLVR
ncbi:hypothetical protein CASFOL_018702 [Castilleja foliolosa]|uniref:Uncharacterized protein n=1 Tax=Castilleja foliolosa TaxID=1961234 RepID=A0ABD3D8E7_9LAMI